MNCFDRSVGTDTNCACNCDLQMSNRGWSSVTWRCSLNEAVDALTRMQTADPDSAVSKHHTGLDYSDSDGPHKSVRQEAVARLRVTPQRMVANHNKQSWVCSFKVGDCVGVKVERANRGHCDRKFVLVSSLTSIAAISISWAVKMVWLILDTELVTCNHFPASTGSHLQQMTALMVCHTWRSLGPPDCSHMPKSQLWAVTVLLCNAQPVIANAFVQRWNAPPGAMLARNASTGVSIDDMVLTHFPMIVQRAWVFNQMLVVIRWWYMYSTTRDQYAQVAWHCFEFH